MCFLCRSTLYDVMSMMCGAHPSISFKKEMHNYGWSSMRTRRGVRKSAMIQRLPSHTTFIQARKKEERNQPCGRSSGYNACRSLTFILKRIRSRQSWACKKTTIVIHHTRYQRRLLGGMAGAQTKRRTIGLPIFSRYWRCITTYDNTTENPEHVSSFLQWRKLLSHFFLIKTNNREVLLHIQGGTDSSLAAILSLPFQKTENIVQGR